MKKLFVILFLIVPSYAMAQDVAKTAKPINTPATTIVANGSPITPKADEKKAPPIIVLPPDVVKPLNEIQTIRRVFELELENAKLKAANAELQLKAAGDAFTKAFNEAYIKAGGTTGDGQYKWDILPDGAWRVTKTVEPDAKKP